MKTMSFKNRIYTMLMFALVIISLPACENDDVTTPFTLKEELIGTWDITSYKLNGEEYIPSLVKSATIQFNPFTGLQGQFTQEVTFSDEESLTLTGDYEVDEEEKEVRMEYEGDVITAEIEITGGNMMDWESIRDEYPLIIKANKR
jgi:hypothetical protein